MRQATERAANLRADLIACTIANVNRGKGKRAIRPPHFFRDMARDLRPPTPEELAALEHRAAPSLSIRTKVAQA